MPFSRNINQEDAKTEDKSEDWKLISVATLEGSKTVLALLTVDGVLATCSIIQRLNDVTSMKTSNSFSCLPSPAAAAAFSAIGAGLVTAATPNGHALDLFTASSSGSTVRFKNTSPPMSIKSLTSRPPSAEKLHQDMLTPLKPMAQAKCAVGAACLDGKLVVCGKFAYYSILMLITLSCVMVAVVVGRVGKRWVPVSNPRRVRTQNPVGSRKGV